MELPKCATTAFYMSGRGLRRLAIDLLHVILVPAHVDFAAEEDAAVAVCVLPGTELAFSHTVTVSDHRFIVGWKTETLAYATAIFRQVNKHDLLVHHDALEFPDGRFVLLTKLVVGQKATVLQLPARPTTAAEVDAQKRLNYVG